MVHAVFALRRILLLLQPAFGVALRLALAHGNGPLDNCRSGPGLFHALLLRSHRRVFRGARLGAKADGRAILAADRFCYTGRALLGFARLLRGLRHRRDGADHLVMRAEHRVALARQFLQLAKGARFGVERELFPVRKVGLAGEKKK